MRRQVDVHYGERKLRFTVEETRLAFELAPADVAPVASVEEAVVSALRAPIGTSPLREVIPAGAQVVILGDDQTRLTPTDRIVPALLDEINSAGVPDQNVTVVVATGTHRELTEAEMAAKYGHAVTDRVRVVNHDCLDSGNLVHFGVTQRGTDIWVNRQAVEADLRIGVGNIVPHHPTGWSGGAKILLPGVAGRHTTGQMHLLGASEQQLGKVETPCRDEMEDFAGAVGLDFIINTVLNRNGQVCHVVAGHFVDAHREGVQRAQQVLGIPFGRRAGLVLASAYPIDFDLFQADKGLFSAAIGARPGGEILLLSPCRDGVSPTHPEAVGLAALSDEELWRLTEKPGAFDPLSIAEALYFNTIKSRFRATLVTEGIPRTVVEEMGFGCLEPDRVPEYVEARLEQESELDLGILHHCVDVLPIYCPSEGEAMK